MGKNGRGGRLQDKGTERLNKGKEGEDSSSRKTTGSEARSEIAKAGRASTGSRAARWERTESV